MTGTRPYRALVALSVAAAIAGCGGDDAPDESRTKTGTKTTSSPPAPKHDGTKAADAPARETPKKRAAAGRTSGKPTPKAATNADKAPAPQVPLSRRQRELERRMKDQGGKTRILSPRELKAIELEKQRGAPKPKPQSERDRLAIEHNKARG